MALMWTQWCFKEHSHSPWPHWVLSAQQFFFVFNLLWWFNLIWFHSELQLEIYDGQPWSWTQASSLSIILFLSHSEVLSTQNQRWFTIVACWGESRTCCRHSTEVLLVVYARGGFFSLCERSSLRNAFQQYRSISVELAKNIVLLFTLSFFVFKIS